MSIQSDNAEQAAWAATQTPPADIGVEELTAYLKSLGIQGSAIRCFADPYDPVTPAWMQSSLAALWKSEVDRMGLLKIKAVDGADGINCVDFSRGCAWNGQVLYKKLNGGRPGAIFAFAYTKADGAGWKEHEIVGCVRRNPDRSLAIAFFEPQPTKTEGGFVVEVLKPVTLTAEEIKSADIEF